MHLSSNKMDLVDCLNGEKRNWASNGNDADLVHGTNLTLYYFKLQSTLYAAKTNTETLTADWKNQRQ